MIDIVFTMNNGIYSFTDALHLEDNHPFTEAEIEAMKQERFDNWLAIVNNPDQPVIVDLDTSEYSVSIDEPQG